MLNGLDIIKISNIIQYFHRKLYALIEHKTEIKIFCNLPGVGSMHYLEG